MMGAEIPVLMVCGRAPNGIGPVSTYVERVVVMV